MVSLTGRQSTIRRTRQSKRGVACRDILRSSGFSLRLVPASLRRLEGRARVCRSPANAPSLQDTEYKKQTITKLESELVRSNEDLASYQKEIKARLDLRDVAELFRLHPQCWDFGFASSLQRKKTFLNAQQGLARESWQFFDHVNSQSSQSTQSFHSSRCNLQLDKASQLLSNPPQRWLKGSSSHRGAEHLS